VFCLWMSNVDRDESDDGPVEVVGAMERRRVELVDFR